MPKYNATTLEKTIEAQAHWKITRRYAVLWVKRCAELGLDPILTNPRDQFPHWEIEGPSGRRIHHYILVDGKWKHPTQTQTAAYLKGLPVPGIDAK
jgi:hypothetical protein